MSAHEMVETAASQYEVSPDEYCHFMRQDSYWGGCGGPKIVALCNVLQRPIHVYELHDSNKQYVLRRVGCFVSPKLDQPLAFLVLSADARFRDLRLRKQTAIGNHFLPIFPEEETEEQKNEETEEQMKTQGFG